MPANANAAKRSDDRAEVVQRAFALDTKAIDSEARTVDVILSTDTIDRYEEIVALDWLLEPYRSNPVVIWAHNSYELPIGRCENVRVEGNALRGTIKFASKEANPKAEQCFQLFKERVLNAVSVGFISHRRRIEESNGTEIVVLEQNELVELSATCVPANPQALAERRARALAARSAEPTTHEPSARENQYMPQDEKMIEALNADHAKALDAANAKTAAAEKAHAETSAKLADAEKRASDADAKCKALESERDSASAALKAASDKLTERDVDALIGKKIAPSQKASMLALALENRKAFDDVVAAMPEMKLFGSVIPEEKGSPAPVAAAPGDALAAAIDKMQ